MKRASIVAVTGIVLLWFGLLVTDTRVLIGEVKIDPGQDYGVEGYRNLKEDKQAALVCSYFNERKILRTVFWYSPNNLLGRDSCPFLRYGLPNVPGQ